ncbi:hypothetical protein ACH5RR_040397 [Cinchona calisaya]|uniref:Disease resistance protein RPM1-like n=1 Tax=Cinchona calisaya TaxID=153742 RepID=A0ABD2XVV5_9GENT
MAETVLSFVLDQLSIFLREEGRLLGGLRQQVQLISDELGHMRAFLKVAEAKEDDDPRLQEWIKQVREAAYDTEDVLDEFVFRFARQRSKGFYGSVKRIFNSIKNLRARHRVASEIQSIQARIKQISEGHQRYQSEYGISTDQVSGSAAAVDKKAWRYSRDDALLVEEARLVGIDKPKQQLISQLLEGDSEFKVISVVGMGGLGKTTLVKKVHEDADVRRHFQIRAWITVSQTFNYEELLKSLIRKLHAEIKKPVPQWIESVTSPSELKEFIKDFLQHGRYLIVFDDVWDVEFWNSIKFAMPENNNGSRLMLTTRKMDVASASCEGSREHVHKMKSLSYEESWTLFCNRTFENGCCPNHLKKVAEVLLGKCDGLPLAILAISGLLALKDVSRIDEWEMVRLSLGGELESTGKLDRVNNILCLSYNDLPSHLKTCLLYMSIFPEDYEIQCQRLIQLWIVERFVEKRGGMTIEDVAYDYLKELVNRSLIQLTDVFYEGLPDTCRIHDLLREVIVSKCWEQNIATVTTGQHTRWPEKVQRLAIHNLYDNSSQESRCFDHLRSLITFESTESLPQKLLSELLSSKLLKVLDLGKTQLEEIPNEIFNLFHLKYLCLRETRVKTVPKSIGKLQNLEYLNLGKTEVRELPMEIKKLKKLSHLIVYKRIFNYEDDYYEYCGFKTWAKIGELPALQKLRYIDAAENDDETSGIVKEIGKLTQLRELGITNLRRKDGKELCSSLEKLANIKELIVYSTRKDEVIDLDHSIPSSSSSSSSLQSLRWLALNGHLEKMPQWIACLQGLVRIDLFWSGLRQNPLESLQYLPNLGEVALKNAYQGEGLCFKAGGFLKLKVLYLGVSKGLRWMRVEEGAMPRLQKLSLEGIPLLKELPFGIQHLRQLQKLDLVEMSSQLIDKLESEGGGQDYQQIAHIPQVIIYRWTDGEWNERLLSGK